METASEATKETKPAENKKRRQILDAASKLFYEYGFEGTSVDEIVRSSGVSKPTLYAHFSDKRTLFQAFMEEELTQFADEMFSLEVTGNSFEARLRNIGSHYIIFLLGERGQAIVRTVLAESLRFPKIGAAFIRSGPEVGLAYLKKEIENAVQAGDIDLEDSELAAYQFFELCRADLFWRKIFNAAGKQAVSQSDIDRVIDQAVDMFMRAYGRS